MRLKGSSWQVTHDAWHAKPSKGPYSKQRPKVTSMDSHGQIPWFVVWTYMPQRWQSSKSTGLPKESKLFVKILNGCAWSLQWHCCGSWSRFWCSQGRPACRRLQRRPSNWLSPPCSSNFNRFSPFLSLIKIFLFFTSKRQLMCWSLAPKENLNLTHPFCVKQSFWQSDVINWVTVAFYWIFNYKTKLTYFNSTEKLLEFPLRKNMDRNKSKKTKERRFYLVFHLETKHKKRSITQPRCPPGFSNFNLKLLRTLEHEGKWRRWFFKGKIDYDEKVKSSNPFNALFFRVKEQKLKFAFFPAYKQEGPFKERS